MRNFIGILFLIVSGLLICGLCNIAFYNLSEFREAKAIMIVIIFVFILIVHSLGLLFYRGAHWKVATGITFFWGAAAGLLSAATMLSMKYSGELDDPMLIYELAKFSDYFTGTIVSLAFLALGAVFYSSGKSIRHNERI